MEEWYRQLIIDFIESLTNKWDIEKEKAMYVCVYIIIKQVLVTYLN